MRTIKEGEKEEKKRMNTNFAQLKTGVLYIAPMPVTSTTIYAYFSKENIVITLSSLPIDHKTG